MPLGQNQIKSIPYSVLKEKYILELGDEDLHFGDFLKQLSQDPDIQNYRIDFDDLEDLIIYMKNIEANDFKQFFMSKMDILKISGMVQAFAQCGDFINPLDKFATEEYYASLFKVIVEIKHFAALIDFFSETHDRESLICAIEYLSKSDWKHEMMKSEIIKHCKLEGEYLFTALT